MLLVINLLVAILNLLMDKIALKTAISVTWFCNYLYKKVITVREGFSEHVYISWTSKHYPYNRRGQQKS